MLNNRAEITNITQNDPLAELANEMEKALLRVRQENENKISAVINAPENTFKTIFSTSFFQTYPASEKYKLKNVPDVIWLNICSFLRAKESTNIIFLCHATIFIGNSDAVVKRLLVRQLEIGYTHLKNSVKKTIALGNELTSLTEKMPTFSPKSQKIKFRLSGSAQNSNNNTNNNDSNDKPTQSLFKTG